MKIFGRLVLYLIMCVVPLVAKSDTPRGPVTGIHIKSYPLSQPERTSIMLDGGNPIGMPGSGLRLEMDVWVFQDNPLGSVCRVITDNGGNIDLMYGVGRDNVRYPLIVAGDKDVVQDVPVDYTGWTHVVLMLSPSDGVVTLDYNGSVSQVSYPELKETSSVRISVGRCVLEGYELPDVASVAVKDLNIRNGRGEALRLWKFDRHNGDVCYDEVSGSPAETLNPDWLTDHRVTWEKIYTATYDYFPSIAFDPVVSTFYMAYRDDKSLYVYHSPENITDTIRINDGEYAANYPNQLIYIRQLHSLLSFNLDQDIYAPFNSVEHVWCGHDRSTKDHDYWNNTTVYSPADSSLISFGGYGHYQYKNMLLRSYPFSSREQTSVVVKEIQPRYSCSSVLVDSLLYIFGGRGNPSGRQELTQYFYYDLYALNINNNKVTKLWSHESSPFDGDFVPGENMVYDKNEGCLYALLTYHQGSLAKIDMTTGKFELMSLPIGVSLDSQTLYINLYFSSEQKSFYAVFVNSDVEGKSEVNIYRLAYPPVSVASLVQPAGPMAGSDGNRAVMWIVAVALLLLACGGAVYYRKRCSARGKNRKFDKEPIEITPPDFRERAVNQDIIPSMPKVASDAEVLANVARTPVSDANPAAPAVVYYNLERGCVRLFGGFRVYDKDGADITPLFTPTLKQLLILLILYTGQNQNGVPNNKLLTLLWGDKEEDAAKNNRNVYISRLRNLLTNIGDVTIQTHNGFRSICFGEGTMCDYLEALKLFDSREGENLDRLLELLFNGMMLPNVELSYVDSFKSEFSNRTLDLLSDMIYREGLSNEMRMKIADTLFQHDYVNEDALFMKCRILYLQGRTGMAQTVYATFCKEYKSLMGMDYPHPFIEVIEPAKR